MADEDTCPACGEGAADRYEAQDGVFRIWCGFRGHSTQVHPDLDEARFEWLGSLDVPEPPAASPRAR